MAIHIKKSRNMRHNMALRSSPFQENNSCHDQTSKRAIFRRKLESVRSCSSQEQTIVSTISKDGVCHSRKCSPSSGSLVGVNSENRSLDLTKPPTSNNQQDIATDRRHSTAIARSALYIYAFCLVSMSLILFIIPYLYRPLYI